VLGEEDRKPSFIVGKKSNDWRGKAEKKKE